MDHRLSFRHQWKHQATENLSVDLQMLFFRFYCLHFQVCQRHKARRSECLMGIGILHQFRSQHSGREVMIVLEVLQRERFKKHMRKFCLVGLL